MIGLQLKKVSFSYFNGLVLQDIDLIIKPGEMVLVAIKGYRNGRASTLLANSRLAR
jgi:ABC-type multidrug transport system fused ATPase/permease subunit